MENIESILKDDSYLEFLSKNKTLKQRISETEQILQQYKNTTFEKVADKLKKIMLPEKYQKGDYYEVELYSKFKPKKELNYIWNKLENPLRPTFVLGVLNCIQQLLLKSQEN